MSTFALASACFLELEESDYDETLEGIAVADLLMRSDSRPDRVFRVRLVELADALKSMLFKCVLQEGQYSEPLWDTGEYVGMRRISPSQVAVELPIGIGAINVATSEVSDFVVLLYKEALTALLVHAGTKALR